MMPTVAQPRPRSAQLRRAPRREPRGERRGIGHLDPLLLVAAIGLIAFSVLTLALTTQGDVPGDPYYYAIRQAIYGVIGIALMLALARIDYSRFRELRVGIYTLMIVSIAARASCSATRRADRNRWIELPFFTFQPSELGKVLLMLALARLRHRQGPADVRGAADRASAPARAGRRRRWSSSSRTSARRWCSA